MTVTADYCVIGAGIVGLATANALLDRHPGASVVILDKEPEVARHQTGHNSGVIHSGIYYEPGSLKARLSIAGGQATRAFCRAHDIPVRNCGKLLVATNDLEIERMKVLEDRAAVHGIEVEPLDADALRRREPNIDGVGALFVPSTGIVDYSAVCRALADQLRDRGASVILNTRVTGINELSDHVRVSTSDDEVNASSLVSCAGLQADRVARLAGLHLDTQIVPFRGEYFSLDPLMGDYVSTLIYPIPDPDLPFLGIHISPTIDGHITVGPSAVLGMAREGYPKFSIAPADVLSYASFIGLWRMARNNARTAVRELKNSLFKSNYLREAQKYAPSLRLSDLRPYEAGIRAQAVHRDGTLLHDFHIARTGRTVHVLNAPSPAATAAFPIGDHIASTVEESAV